MPKISPRKLKSPKRNPSKKIESPKSKDNKIIRSIKSPIKTKPPTPVLCKSRIKVIYLDNNATTLICPDALNEFQKWLPCFNPASDSKAIQPVKTLIEKSKEYIEKHCSINPKKYTVIFTSGATESNCFVLRSTAESYQRLQNTIPHFIISELEHSSILDCCFNMEKNKQIELSLVPPNIYGCILPTHVEKYIKNNTALISIMYAQNEIGSINNVYDIAKLAHQHAIPFHTDAVQIFGKCQLDIPKLGIDALSASFHKFYGPKGIGLLILNNDFINGYQLHAQISGHQQKGLRGGTENPAAIAAAITAMKWNFTQRKQKNKYLLRLRDYIITELGKHFKWGDYLNYCTKLSKSQIKSPKSTKSIKSIKSIKSLKAPKSPKSIHKGSKEQITTNKSDLELILIGPPPSEKSFYLPNTLLIAVAKNKGKEFCNIKFKHALDSQNVIVSIGSACLTDSDKASHVLDAIGAPKVIKRGTIRISLGDYNTFDEIKQFCKIFVNTLDASHPTR
jgi:cysteine desulfurase